jgi:hypothetical protein
VPGQREDGAQVLAGVVVGEDGAGAAGGGAHVAAGGAQVAGRRGGGVEEVERVGRAVAVGVHAVDGPGRGDELHRPDGAVEDLVTVQATAVGVGDAGRSAAVERDADDPRQRAAVGVQRRPGEAAVIGLDPADGGKQRPVDPAVRVGPVGGCCRTPVGEQGGGGDAVRGQDGGGDGRRTVPVLADRDGQAAGDGRRHRRDVQTGGEHRHDGERRRGARGRRRRHPLGRLRTDRLRAARVAARPRQQDGRRSQGTGDGDAPRPDGPTGVAVAGPMAPGGRPAVVRSGALVQWDPQEKDGSFIGARLVLVIVRPQNRRDTRS